MFHTSGDFFMAAVHHRTFLWVAEVSACSLHDITRFWVMVFALRTFKATLGWVEIPCESAFVAVVNRCVRSQIRDAVIGIIPNSFQSFRVLFQIRIFAVIDEAAARMGQVFFFEIQFVEWCWLFADIVLLYPRFPDIY